MSDRPCFINPDQLAALLGMPRWPQDIDVRFIETDDLALSPEAAGYLAASLGLSVLSGDDDQAMVRHGSVLLDGLYAWIVNARHETHSWKSRA